LSRRSMGIETQVNQTSLGPLFDPEGEVTFAGLIGVRSRRIKEEDQELQEATNLYLEKMSNYPFFTAQQNQVVFQYISQGNSVNELGKDPQFLNLVKSEQQEKMLLVLKESKTIKDLAVTCNLRLVPPAIKRYRGLLPFLDLIQEGNIGLMRAVDKYDLKRDRQFSSCAYRYIRTQAFQAVAASLLISLPVEIQLVLRKIVLIAGEFEVEQGRRPKVRELQELLLQQSNLLNKARAIRQINTGFLVAQSGITEIRSLETTFGQDENPLLNIIPDYRTDTSQEANQKANIKRVEEVMEKLSARQKRALKLRFGLDDEEERTLEEIGQEFGVTRQRAEQIINAALEKIRKKQSITIEEPMLEIDEPSNPEYNTQPADLNSMRYEEGTEVSPDSGDNKKQLPKRMLTIQEAAHRLHVHANTVKRWSNSGQLRAYRIGRRKDRRYDPDDINRFLGILPSKELEA